MVSLLERLGLNERLYNHPNFSIDKNIDYKKVVNVLEDWRNDSALYLNNQLRDSAV